MSDQLISSVVTVATAIIGVAIVAVLVGTNSQTANVLSSAGSALANDLKAAEAPVLGGSGLGSLTSFTGGQAGSMNFY